MGMNPHANGGLLLQRAAYAGFSRICGEVKQPGGAGNGSDADAGEIFCAT